MAHNEAHLFRGLRALLDDPDAAPQALELFAMFDPGAQGRFVQRILGIAPRTLSPSMGTLRFLLQVPGALRRVERLTLPEGDGTLDLTPLTNLRTLNAQRFRGKLTGRPARLERLAAGNGTDARGLWHAPRLHSISAVGAQIGAHRPPALEHLVVDRGIVTDVDAIMPGLRTLALKRPYHVAGIRGTIEALAVWLREDHDKTLYLHRRELPNLKLLITFGGNIAHTLRCAWIDPVQRRWDPCPSGLDLPFDLHGIWRPAHGADSMFGGKDARLEWRAAH